MNLNRRFTNEPDQNLAIGKIIEVDGSRIVAELNSEIQELSRIYSGEAYQIGQFGSMVKIHFGRRTIYALVALLRMKAEYEQGRGLVVTASKDERVVEADLFGEGEWTRSSDGSDKLVFERGISTYPLPQQTVYLTPKSELRAIYARSSNPSILLGEHVGAGGAPCYADLNELLGKHTAVLGSTGTGKSAAVAAIIHSLLKPEGIKPDTNWNPKIIILDPHREYGAAFPDASTVSTDDQTLNLPYWLLNLQELSNLLIGRTASAATSQANIVKDALTRARQEGAERIGLAVDRITVDSPIPFSLSKFKQAIENARPSAVSSQGPYNSILQKLETLTSDARLDFLMVEWEGGTDDPLPAIIGQLIGKSAVPCVVDLSGVPNEVAGISSAVIARTLFNWKVWQSEEERRRDPVLLVCEEAHRYVPNRGDAQYEGAQEAIRRIAKEGRKYGIGMMLVSQRPSEVEATVLSQCNSWLILRLTNDGDREHVRSILPDSMAGLTKILSGLRRREAVFVGQASVVPSRIMIRELAPEELPASNDVDFHSGWQSEIPSKEQLKEVGNRWRYQDRR